MTEPHWLDTYGKDDNESFEGNRVWKRRPIFHDARRIGKLNKMEEDIRGLTAHFTLTDEGVRMFHNETLRYAAEEALRKVKLQIKEVETEANGRLVSPYQIKDGNGQYLLSPLLAAQSQLLHTLTLLEDIRTYDEDSEEQLEDLEEIPTDGIWIVYLWDLDVKVISTHRYIMNAIRDLSTGLKIAFVPTGMRVSEAVEKWESGRR